MASTYTTNNGIELIGTGEQSGTWGDTTNTNFELIDASLDGQVSIELASTGTSGSPNTVAITDGDSSDGRNRMFIFTDGASFSGDAYVQLTPNDAEKIVYVRNNFSSSSPRSIILFQGNYDAANAYTVPRGKTAVVYFNGSGLGAVAANMFNNAHFDALNLVGNADVGGNLTVTGDVVAGDDVSLQSDGAILNFGADNDVSLTHVADTAIRLNSDKALQFRDAAISIASSADGQLDIDADTEVEITTTTLDIDATTTDISGTLAASSITEGGTALASKYLGITANADSASKWQTARTITLTGDVSGTATGVDGQDNISIATTIQADRVALGTDTTGNYVQSLATTSPLSGGAAGSEGSALTIALSAAYGDTENPYGSKSANLVLASPSSGSDSPPSFRSLVAADIPSLAISKISGLQSSLNGKLNLTGGALSSDLTIAGDVGIGTTSPEVELHVDGKLLVNAYDYDNSGIFFREQFSAESNSYVTDHPYNLSIMTYDHSGGNNTRDGLSINAYDGVSFCTGSNTRQQRMIITDSGNINIGSTSSSVNPTATLEVTAPSTQYNPLRVSGSYTGNHPVGLYLYNYSTTQNNSEKLRIQVGNIGNTTNNFYNRRHHSEIYFEPNGTSGGEMAFLTGGKSGSVNTVEALRLKSNQDAEFSGSITAADGILFGSDTAAANTLHDYEEGTFDPYFTTHLSDFDYIEYYPSTATSQSSHRAYRGSTSGANSYIKHDGSVRGWYTKIGDMVYISIWLYTQNISTTDVTGSVRIGGLPYAPPVYAESPFSSYIFKRKAFNSFSVAYTWHWNTAPTNAMLFNDGFIWLYTHSSNTSNPTNTVVADFNTGTAKNIINVSGHYRVNV